MDHKHVGKIGTKVVLADFEVISIFNSKNHGGFVVKGICDDALFMFYTQRNLESIKQGDKIQLEAKVKDHIIEKEKYAMTRIKYVTIKGLENVENLPNNDAFSFI
jgi:hypothetical protein